MIICFNFFKLTDRGTGLTPFVQAVNFGIFKNKLKNSDEVEKTRGGNPKPPKGDAICRWIVQAWQQVTAFNIINSIKAAGIGL